MNERSSSASLSITNLLSTPAPVEIEVKRWSQTPSSDVLEPTNDIVFAPPIVIVPAKGQSTIRFRSTRPLQPGEESAYRVYVTELPRPTPLAPVGTSFRLTFGLPLFVQGDGLGRAGIEVDTRTEDGEFRVIVTNTGGRSVRVYTVEAFDRRFSRREPKPTPHTAFRRREGTTNTLLPGTTRSWVADGAALPDSAQILMLTDDLQGRAHREMRPGGLLWITMDGVPTANR